MTKSRKTKHLATGQAERESRRAQEIQAKNCNGQRHRGLKIFHLGNFSKKALPKNFQCRVCVCVCLGQGREEKEAI